MTESHPQLVRRRRNNSAKFWLVKYVPMLVVLLAFAVYNYERLVSEEPLARNKRQTPVSVGRSLFDDHDNDDDDGDCDESKGYDKDPDNFPGGCKAYYDTCQDQDSEVNYLKFINCTARTVPWKVLTYIAMAVEMFILFYVLGDTADVYFSPALMSISDLLHLSPSLAGVTFLALGNGAPDCFSQAAAVMDTSGAGAPLGLASALGGGIFVTTVVMGAVALVNKKPINRRPFIRDVVFYLVAVIFLLVIAFDGEVYLWEACACLGYYVLFVVIVVAGRITFQMMKRRKRRQRKSGFAHEPLVESLAVDGVGTYEPETDEDEVIPDPMRELLKMRHKLAHDSHHHHNHNRPRANSEPLDVNADFADHDALMRRNQQITTDSRVRSASDTLVSGGAYVEFDDNLTWEDRKAMIEEKRRTSEKLGFCGHIKEMMLDSWEEFMDRGCFSKGFFILEIPLRLVRNLTIPAMDEGDWNRIFAILNPFCSVVAFFVFLHLYTYWYVFIGCSALALLVSIFMFFITNFDSPPRFYSVMSLWAFIMSVLWIYKIATELVAVLDTMGALLGIPPTVLGVTILAWGNSLGDLIADVAIARAGEPAMAVGGVYAGPLFNVLAGLFGPMLVPILRSDSKKYVLVPENDGNTIFYSITFGCLITALLISLVMVPCFKFTPNKLLGGALILLYCVFLPVNVFVSLHYKIGLDE